MEIALQYVSDMEGNPQAVLLQFTEWEKILNKLRKYEQAFKLRSDLKDAYEQVAALKHTKKKKQTLNEFLNEL